MGSMSLDIKCIWIYFLEETMRNGRKEDGPDGPDLERIRADNEVYFIRQWIQ